MDSQTLLQEAKQLPPADRIALVEQIWDSIAERQAPIPMTDAQRQELDRRLAARQESPDAGKSWEETKSAILSDE